MKVLHICLLLIPAFGFAQPAITDPDSLIDIDTISYRKDRVHVYYSQDHESRSVFTDHGLFDGTQVKHQSWTLGIGWTGDFTKHITASAGIELSAKSVNTGFLEINDTIERSVSYHNELSYMNIPLTIQYMIGRKFRIGVFAGTAVKFKIKEGGTSYRNHHDGSGTSDPQPGNKNYPFNEKYRYNQDVRAGVVVEYNFRKSRLRLMPVYRLDLLKTYRDIPCDKARNYGLSLEYNL